MTSAFSRALYAVYSNPLAGRDDDLHAWYEDVHIPDSLGHGLFDSVRRYRAADAFPCRARYLALWSCAYADETAALAAVRPVAETLRAAGRIEVVQEVVFQRFLFLARALRERTRARAASLVTLHSCWARPDDAARFDAWLGGRAEGFVGTGTDGVARYASASAQALLLLESEAEPGTLADAWKGAAETGLPPFGAPTPIFRAGSPAPGPPPLPPPGDAELARWRPAWAACWSLISSRGAPL